jgi:hypothetical protein
MISHHRESHRTTTESRFSDRRLAMWITEEARKRRNMAIVQKGSEFFKMRLPPLAARTLVGSKPTPDDSADKIDVEMIG